MFICAAAAIIGSLQVALLAYCRAQTTILNDATGTTTQIDTSLEPTPHNDFFLFEALEHIKIDGNQTRVPLVARFPFCVVSDDATSSRAAHIRIVEMGSDSMLGEAGRRWYSVNIFDQTQRSGNASRLEASFYAAKTNNTGDAAAVHEGTLPTVKHYLSLPQPCECKHLLRNNKAMQMLRHSASYAIETFVSSSNYVHVTGFKTAEQFVFDQLVTLNPMDNKRQVVACAIISDKSVFNALNQPLKI